MTDTDAVIAADVGNFIARCIDTVPHLEGLLLMWQSAPQRWTEAGIAARIYVTPDIARRVVQDLERHGLILRDADSPIDYTFNAHSDAAALLPMVARAYRDCLVPVTRLIHAKV